MKRIIILMAFLMIGIAFQGETNAKNNHDFGGGVYFYSSLAPYGRWIQIDAGVTVWQPGRISASWAPYTEGYWEWTNDGWYWESNEPFGYITFHYGRWYYDDYYGWIWVPDNQWAPAWVEWRYDDDYIGWAPLPPYAGFSISIGINFSRRYETPFGHWHFLRYRHMCDPYGYRYYVPSAEVYGFYSRTKYRTNYGYSNGRVINRGVNIDFVRNRGGRDIRERTIERVSDPNLIRDNGGRSSGRILTFAPGRENINRENVNERSMERSERRSSLDFSKIDVGRDRTTDYNTRERDVARDRSGYRNEGLTRERTIEKRDANGVEKRTGQDNPFFNRDRAVEKNNANNRSSIERNRTTSRPRSEAPRVKNNQQRESPKVRTERNTDRKNERNQNDKGTKRKR